MASYKVEICGVNTAKLPRYKEAEMMEMIEKIQTGDKEVRDEKAVNIAIRRLYEGQYVITHKSVEEQEREERAVLEGIGEPAQQFAEREEDEILDGDRNADDAVLDDDAAPEDGEAAETDSGDAADAVTEDETAADAVAEEEVEAAEAAEAEAVEESDADGSAGTSEN